MGPFFSSDEQSVCKKKKLHTPGDYFALDELHETLLVPVVCKCTMLTMGDATSQTRNWGNMNHIATHWPGSTAEIFVSIFF